MDLCATVIFDWRLFGDPAIVTPDKELSLGEQDGRVAKTPAFESKGLRFDPQ